MVNANFVIKVFYNAKLYKRQVVVMEWCPKTSINAINKLKFATTIRFIVIKQFKSQLKVISHKEINFFLV